MHNQQPEAVKAGGPYYRVIAVHSRESYLCTYSEPVMDGSYIMFASNYGVDLGKALGTIKEPSEEELSQAVEIQRIATEHDIHTFQENLVKELDIFKVCKEHIEAHQLDMKLVSAHILTEESKVLFFFTAETRVDFRELVKDLVATFKKRIELRQIGVRDESRVVGGIAVCGRQYCCHSITDRLQPVSIKMAKEQNLSLNSMKISGPCGRLLCCLSYEYEYYKEEKRNYPNTGIRITFEDLQYKVIDSNILNKSVKLSSNEGGIIDVPIGHFYRDNDTGKWRISSLPESE
ncbi:MAG: hypothetical protein JXB03_06305 [Spirochaetales bacterium]|nr:hypothetical protein [Spirochaetales bacterium]